MALTKTTDLENGYEANYFRVVKLLTDLDTDRCVIRVYLYKDAAARGDDLPAVKIYEYEVARSVMFDKEAEEIDNPLHAAYQHLKSLAFYSGAVDS